jgi:L-iditol 2-dehydrogenase
VTVGAKDDISSGPYLGRCRELHFDGRQLSVRHTAVQQVGAEDVLVQIRSCGVCSSDFHFWAGRKSGEEGVCGHEGGGLVAAVGPSVSSVQPGDAVVIMPLVECLKCNECIAGNAHLCPSRRIIGYDGNGLLRDLVVVPQRCLVRIPFLKSGTECLVEPLACVLHAWSRCSGKTSLETVVILGAGTMGALHAIVASFKGAKDIIMFESRDDKAALARSRLPVSAVWHPSEGADELELRTNGLGANLVILANSSRSSHEMAFDLVADGGVVLGFASILDKAGPLRIVRSMIDTDALHRTEVDRSICTARGTCVFCGAIGFDRASFTESIRLLSEQLVDGDTLITASVDLQDIPRLAQGEWEAHWKVRFVPHSSREFTRDRPCPEV